MRHSDNLAIEGLIANIKSNSKDDYWRLSSDLNKDDIIDLGWFYDTNSMLGSEICYKSKERVTLAVYNTFCDVLQLLFNIGIKFFLLRLIYSQRDCSESSRRYYLYDLRCKLASIGLIEFSYIVSNYNMAENVHYDEVFIGVGSLVPGNKLLFSSLEMMFRHYSLLHKDRISSYSVLELIESRDILKCFTILFSNYGFENHYFFVYKADSFMYNDLEDLLCYGSGYGRVIIGRADNCPTSRVRGVKDDVSYETMFTNMFRAFFIIIKYYVKDNFVYQVDSESIMSCKLVSRSNVFDFLKDNFISLGLSWLKHNFVQILQVNFDNYINLYFESSLKILKQYVNIILPTIDINYNLIEFLDGVYYKPSDVFLSFEELELVYVREFDVKCYNYFRVNFNNLIEPEYFLSCIKKVLVDPSVCSNLCIELGAQFFGNSVGERLSTLYGLQLFGEFRASWRLSLEENGLLYYLKQLLTRFVRTDDIVFLSLVKLLWPIWMALHLGNEIFSKSRLRVYAEIDLVDTANIEYLLNEVPCIIVYCNRLYYNKRNCGLDESFEYFEAYKDKSRHRGYREIKGLVKMKTVSGS